jgi:hypothetical protein
VVRRYNNAYLEILCLQGNKYTTINVPGAFLTSAHSIDMAGDVVYTWSDLYGVQHG